MPDASHVQYEPAQPLPDTPDSEQPVGRAVRYDVGTNSWIPTNLARNPSNNEVSAFNGKDWIVVHSPSILQKGIQNIKSFVTGEGKGEQLPELMGALGSAELKGTPTADWTTGQFNPADVVDEPKRQAIEAIRKAYLVAPTPEAISDIAVKALKPLDPNVSASKDADGRPIVTFNGQRHYINKPGATGADIAQIAGNTALYAPATAVGAAVGPILGAPVTGGLMGATSLLQDRLAQSMGSEQGADFGRAGLNVVAGAGLHLAGPIISRLVGKIVSGLGPRVSVVDSEGSLTSAGRQFLEKEGVNPDEVGPEFAAEFMKARSQYTDPAMAQRIAESQSLPVPVPETQGSATLSPAVQRAESAAAKGFRGEGAAADFLAKETAQQGALRGNLAEFQQQLAGGAPLVTEKGQAGRNVQKLLSGQEQEAWTGVNKAYDAARAGGEAGVASTDIRPVVDQIGGKIRGSYNLEVNAEAGKILSDLEKSVGGTIPGDHTVLIGKMFQWRERASSALDKGGADAKAIGSMIGDVDQYMKNALEHSVVTGDQATIGAFKTAIAKRAEYGRMFEGEDIIGKLTDMGRRSGKPTLVTPPEEASNAIFGNAQLFGAKNTARDLRLLKSRLGENSPEWKQIQQEAFIRISKLGDGAYDKRRGIVDFSGSTFARELDKLLYNNGPVMRELFPPEFLGQLQQFKRVAARVTGKVSGGDNSSNSGFIVNGQSILSGLARMMGMSPEVASARLGYIPWANRVRGYIASKNLGPRNALTTTPLPLLTPEAGRGAVQPGLEYLQGAVGTPSQPARGPTNPPSARR